MKITNAYRYYINNNYEFVIENGVVDTDLCEFVGYVGNKTGQINPEEGNAGPSTEYGRHLRLVHNKGSVWYKERKDEEAKTEVIKQLNARKEEYLKLIENIDKKIKVIQNDENTILRIKS